MSLLPAICAVSLALIVASPVVFAETSSTQDGGKVVQYPWQTLPERCKGKVPLPENCLFEDWPNHDEAQSKLILLYKTEQFALLERGLEEISALGKVADSGWPLETIVYRTIANWYLSSNFDPEELARINRWKSAIPNSHFVYLAEALFMFNKAWSIRGGGYADTVSAESWKLLDKYQRDAKQILLAAPEKLRTYPAWHHAMLVLAINVDSSERVDQLVEVIANKWPTYYPSFESVAFRLQPKWGASWRQLEAFASKWTSAIESRRPDGGALYARIYLAVRNEASFDEMKPDWVKLKRSFELLVASYPKFKNYKNHFASFACAARDKTTFISAMKLIDNETLMPDAWIKGHSYEACKEWAFVKT